MTDVDSIYWELSRLNNEPYGAARSSAVEQIVRVLEADGPENMLAWGYSSLVDAYVWGGEIEKAFVPFTRWVRWFDEHPEQFDAQDRYSLFWSFKWMVSHASDFPQVPFEQIEATLADMERRYALAGHGMNGVRLEQFRWAWARDTPETPELFRLWTTTPRDEYANCEACDPSEQALYLAETGRVADAVSLIEHTLTGDASCGTEPADMLSQLAEGYLELGRPKESANAYRRAVQHLDGAVGAMASTRGRLVLVLARGGQGDRAVRRIEADQRLLIESDTPWSQLGFLRDVAAATRILAVVDPSVPVRLTEVQVSTVGELAAWSLREARELASAFDARDRTDAHSRRIEKALALEPAAEPLDLSVIPGGTGHAVTSGPSTGAALSGTTASGSSTATELAAQADALVGRGEFEQATPLYLAAVEAHREAGELVDAGIAEANAARCAHELEDIKGADRAYRHAIGVLRAAGAPVTLVSNVARSWIALAFEAGTTTEALDVLSELRDALAERIKTDETPALRKEYAESLDTHARALASLGEHERAVSLASEAAERFAGIGRVADAAHAFWLAGRALVAAGRDDDAVYHLESAVEGFGVARDKEARGKAATDLVDTLRRLGRDGDAEVAARSRG